MKPCFLILLCFIISFATSHAKDENEVTITEASGYRVVQSNAIPDHNTGRFPNSGNPNAISPQNHSLKVTLTPRKTGRFIPAEGPTGVALNGVLFEPATAETWQGDRNWRQEAIVQDERTLGLDKNNAHVQPTGNYHYHGIPWGLVKKQDASTPPTLIGWAADGFPIYYQEGIRSSWQLKSGKREGGPGGKHDGTYTADYEFIEGSGDLDQANGTFGVTPEHPEGIYHYYATETFPYLPRYYAGTPDSSFSRRGGGRGPGGGRHPGGGPDSHPHPYHHDGNRPPHPPPHH